MMTIFIILLLIVLNGLFVAAEFALLGAPRAALEQMGASGNMVARRVSQILKTPRLQDRYIATAQLGITFASLGLGMYGEHAVARWLHEWLAQYGWASWLVAHGAASVLSVAVLTYLHIVLGEMVPKALSLQYATKLCLIITMPMYVIQLCLYPLVVGMNTLGNFFLRLLGVDRNDPNPITILRKNFSTSLRKAMKTAPCRRNPAASWTACLTWKTCMFTRS